MSDHDHFDDDPAFAHVEHLLRSVGAPPDPSDELRARLLQIPRDEARRPSLPVRPTGWRRWWASVAAWRGASAALAAAAVVLAIVALTNGASGSGVSGRAVALTTAPDYQASGSAVSMVTKGMRRIHVQIDGLPPIVGNGVYELWIARDPKHRISLGTFRPNATGTLDATVSVPDLGSAWQGVWLTREPGTGKPGWSRDWVVAGRLTSA